MLTEVVDWRGVIKNIIAPDHLNEARIRTIVSNSPQEPTPSYRTSKAASKTA